MPCGPCMRGSTVHRWAATRTACVELVMTSIPITEETSGSTEDVASEEIMVKVVDPSQSFAVSVRRAPVVAPTVARPSGLV